MAKSSADDVQLRRVCEAAMVGTKQEILLSIRVSKSRGIWGKSVNSGRGHTAKPRVLVLATETKGRHTTAFLRVLKYSNGGILIPAKLYKLKHLSKVEVAASDPTGCTLMLVFDNLISHSVAPPQWTMRNVNDRNRLLFCILNICKSMLGLLPKVDGIDVVEMALWAQENTSAINIITKQQGPRQDGSASIAPAPVGSVRVERELVFQAEEEDTSSDDARPHQTYKVTHSDQHGRQKNGRKGTHMKKLRLKLGKGPKLEVTFDSHLEPIGPDKETVSNFISYISLLARSKVSILIEKWDSVPERNKEEIWQALLETFDVPSNEELKKKWIQYAGERWRAFKTSLGKKYIFGDLQGVLPYVEDYTFIDPDTWEAFVASRQTPEFLAKRKKAQEVQSNNKCPHRLSRGGYKSLKRAIVEEKLRARKEASSDPSAVISPPSPPSRHESWKRARITPQGNYVSEEARVIGDKIDSLEEQCSQGSFTPIGRDDILASALGRPEHPGRVRAVGKGIGIRDYFGPPQPRVSQEQLDVIITQVKQQTQQELQKNWEKMKEQMRAEMMVIIGSQGKSSSVPEPENHSPKGRYVLEPENHSIKGSCVPESKNHSPKGSSAPDTHKEDEYELYVEDPHYQLVAYCRLHALGPTIHHRQMNEDEVRVEVLRVLVGDARVPYPTEEVTTVGETPNQFIAWPKRLVKNVTTKDISQPKQVDPKALFHPNMDVLKRLWIAAADITQPLHILMEAAIVGEKRDMYINQKDIMELLQNQKIGISVMQFYNKYLYDVLKISGRSGKYGLMCPLAIQSKGNTKQEIAVYIRTRITERDFDAFLAPYISEDHWQLMVLCPKENVVTWFCSMWKKPKRDLISKIDTAFEAYQITKGTLTHKLKKPTWIFPKCHKQRGDEESGYFVMRLMLEIITLDSFEKILDMEEPYSKEKIDDVRRRWTRCFLEVTSLVN